MWNLRQNLESSGHQEKYKSHTALRNRCCIDTKRCSGGYTQPQVWHGQLSPRCCVDKRILGGKGFAVGRLKRHVRPVRYGTGVALTLSAVQVDILTTGVAVVLTRTALMS